MNTDEQRSLEKMSGTLEAILSELRKGRERHKELDESLPSIKSGIPTKTSSGLRRQ